MELKYVGSLVRTGLALFAGYLVAHGVSADTANTFISSTGDVLAGISTYSVVQLWSLVNKKDHSD